MSVHVIVFYKRLFSFTLFNQDFTSKYNNMSLAKVSSRDAIVLHGTEEIGVKEEEGILFLLPLVVPAVAADHLFNDGKVTKHVAKEVKSLAFQSMEYLFNLSDELGELFQSLTEKIYDWIGLDKLDDLVKDLVVGSAAGMLDQIIPTVKKHLGNAYDKIQELFDEIKPLLHLVRDGLDAIGASDFIEKIIGPPSSLHEQFEFDKSDEKGSSCTLERFGEALGHGEGPRILKKMEGLLKKAYESLKNDDPSRAMDPVIDCLQELSAVITGPARCWLESLGGLGSIQFIADAGVHAGVGVGVEVGLSIDVGQLLYFITHGFKFDPSFTQIMSLHVGYAFSFGAQAGASAGVAVAYDTSRVTGVGGFGWGVSLEGAFEYKVGASVNWPIPGSHVPNQFVVAPAGAGAEVVVSGSLGHSVSLLHEHLSEIILNPAPTILKQHVIFVTSLTDRSLSAMLIRDLDFCLLRHRLRWQNYLESPCSIMIHLDGLTWTYTLT